MIKISVFLLLFVFICFGIGIQAFKLLNIKNDKFSAVLGFIVLFAALQISYYPAQIFNLHFNYIIVVTSIIFIFGFILSILNIKNIFKELFTKESLLILFSLLVFIFIYSKSFIDIDFSDSSTYLNYIVQNVNIDKLNNFNPVNGVYGKEWDILYLYQGYYHFGSFLCWFINIPYYIFNSTRFVENITIATWGLGTIYNIISVLFIVNIIDYFSIKSKVSKLVIFAYLLFYSNFYYWKVAFSFYGNTYRILICSFLLFYIYRWFKENNENIKNLFPVIIFSGLSFTSSFLFLSFAVMFILACYLFMIQRKKVVYDMFTFVFPIALYGTIMFGKVYRSVLIVCLLVLSIIYIGRLFKQVRRIMYYLDDFFYKYIKVIVYFIFPIILSIISLYINLKIDKYIVNYAHYFNNHQNYDMVKDYFFIYSNILDNVFNCVRWVGVVFIFIQSKSLEDKFIKELLILSILIFLNPLTTSALSYGLTGIVYYRLFEVIFNPFVELIIFIYIYNNINLRVYFKYLFSGVLLGCIILGNVFSFINNPSGLYTFYINGGKSTTVLEKMNPNEVQAIKELRNLVKDDSITVISQSNGLRTFLPNAHQLFTPRDYFYHGERLNDEFYEIARRHYSWDSWDRKKDADYGNTCKYFYEYDVDYIILEYWENERFDNFADNCSKEYFVGSNYKVRIVNK